MLRDRIRGAGLVCALTLTGGLIASEAKADGGRSVELKRAAEPEAAAAVFQRAIGFDLRFSRLALGTLGDPLGRGFEDAMSLTGRADVLPTLVTAAAVVLRQGFPLLERVRRNRRRRHYLRPYFKRGAVTIAWRVLF